MGIMKSKIQVKDFVVILRAFSSYIDGCGLQFLCILKEQK
jgi:hypothetical protein